MYPKIKPFNSFFLKTKDNNHSIYVEECGNRNGVPIVYLHGGPGGSIGPQNRSYFNPKKYRIILFDQRGSGRSKPRGSLINNTTNHLIKDMEQIRKMLKIKQWIIMGGSWGSTLGLIYTINNPNKVLGMVLRGVFLGTKNEANWAFHYSADYFYPELIDIIKKKIKKKEEKVFLELGKMLTSKNKKKINFAAQIWEKYERTLSILTPKTIKKEMFNKIKLIKILPNSPFLEWYYTKNNFFLKNNEIIKNLKRIKKIPTIIIQGRYDLICPPKSAYLIAKHMSNCEIKIIEKCGHSTSEKDLRTNLLKAIDKIYTKISYKKRK